jgi:putative two-component system response regulator
MPASTFSLNLFEHSDPGKILVVDSHPYSRLVAVDQLQPQGYEVREADGSSDIQQDVLKDPPDLILLDIALPTEDGFEVCSRLKLEPSTSRIPVILVAVADEPRLRQQSHAVGADGFLSKPLERAILLPEVERQIQQKRLQEWLEQLQQVLFLISQTVESRGSAADNPDIALDWLARHFGEYLQLSPLEISELIFAAHLHDIGMVAVSDVILLKREKLTEEERKTIEQHVLIGEKISQPLQSRRGISQIIRHHHERWDGSGYPDGLKGSEIPWLAQVFQILDIYNALTSERPYKQALSKAKALDILAEEAAKGWRNPQLVQQFADFICQSEGFNGDRT